MQLGGVDPADAIVVPYHPRKIFLPFHQRSQRFACMVVHRRAGKTVASINEVVARAIYSKRKRPRYAYIGPLLKQAKKIAWEYLKEYTHGLEKKKPSESELSVTLRHNDAEIGVYGADNPDAFRGQYFDGVVLDEYGDMSPSVWGQVLLPTLADRRGWAVFIGTFKGKNHFYKIFRRSQGLDLREGEDPEYFKSTWFNLLLDVYKSGVLPAEEIQLMRMEMDEEDFAQEYMCDPNAAVKGTYYAKFISQLEQSGRIYNDNAAWDPDQQVEVAFDLGFSDSTAAWFYQRRPGGLAIIDYLEAHGQPLRYYFNELLSKGYRYKTIWLPHDAKAKSLQTGRSTVEQFLQAEFPVRIAPKLDIQDGINAVRKVLPMCHFNSKTELGVEALRHYRRAYDDEKKVFSDHPQHDWSSHGSDAFRYLSLVAHEITAEDEAEKKIILPNDHMRLAILFEERERRLSRRRFRL
jgi:phage terminase large subunit